MTYTNDGAKYAVRDFSNSTDSPTAEFFHPFRNRKRTKADMKLRLRTE
jgi:hypothetical protein